jgi:hypothetical protein
LEVCRPSARVGWDAPKIIAAHRPWTSPPLFFSHSSLHLLPFPPSSSLLSSSPSPPSPTPSPAPSPPPPSPAPSPSPPSPAPSPSPTPPPTPPPTPSPPQSPSFFCLQHLVRLHIVSGFSEPPHGTRLDTRLPVQGLAILAFPPGHVIGPIRSFSRPTLSGWDRSDGLRLTLRNLP